MNNLGGLSKLRYETVREALESHPYLRRDGEGNFYSAALEAIARIDKLMDACTFFSPQLIEKCKELKRATELVVAATKQWNERKGAEWHPLSQEDTTAQTETIGGTIKIGSRMMSW